jgi:hypothetical protein
LNPHLRDWEGEATAKRLKLEKDLGHLNRRINACNDEKRMGDLLHCYYLEQELLQKVGNILEF